MIRLYEPGEAGTGTLFTQNLLDFPYIRRLLTPHECYTNYRADMSDMTFVLVRILLEVFRLYGIAELRGNFTDFAEPSFLVVRMVVGL